MLPLNNLSGDPEQQYFSDGLSEHDHVVEAFAPDRADQSLHRVRSATAIGFIRQWDGP